METQRSRGQIRAVMARVRKRDENCADRIEDSRDDSIRFGGISESEEIADFVQIVERLRVKSEVGAHRSPFIADCVFFPSSP